MKVLEELELKEEAIKSSNIRVAPGVTFVLFDSRLTAELACILFLFL
jgi:hypothetical protein